MSTATSPRRRRTASLAACATFALLSGCASNPFLENYVGRTRDPSESPTRLLTEQKLPELGRSRFDIDMVAGEVPGDAEALAAAREVGATAYWWSSRPKFNAGNVASQRQQARGRVGGTAAFGTGYDEKTLKWYQFEAVFYAMPPAE